MAPRKVCAFKTVATINHATTTPSMRLITFPRSSFRVVRGTNRNAGSPAPDYCSQPIERGSAQSTLEFDGGTSALSISTTPGLRTGRNAQAHILKGLSSTENVAAVT